MVINYRAPTKDSVGVEGVGQEVIFSKYVKPRREKTDENDKYQPF